MSSVISSTSGSALVQFSFTDPSAGDSGLILGTDIQHASSTFKEEFNTWKVSSHVLQLSTSAIFDTKIMPYMVAPYPYVWIRRLISGTDGSITVRGWEKLVITSHTSDVPPGNATGHVFKFEAADVLYLFTRGAKNVCRKGVISEIVRGICEEQGVANYIIEPTRNEGHYIQSNMDDFEFIVSRMIPRSINDKGTGGYKLAVVDGVLHFHTLDYAPSGSRVTDVPYTSHSGVSYFKPTDISQLSATDGAAGVRNIAADPLSYSIHSTNVSSSSSAALKYADISVLYPDEFFVNILYHVSENKIPELQALAQNKFQEQYDRQYFAPIGIAMNIDTRLFDTLNMGLGFKSAWSGLYPVTSVTCEIERGMCHTTIGVRRGQINNALGVATDFYNENGQNPALSAQPTNASDTGEYSVDVQTA